RGVSGVENNVLDLTRIAARTLGIARPEDLADYFRQLRAPTDEAITELLATGELREVEVDGGPAPRWQRARTPRPVAARAPRPSQPPLPPFDPRRLFPPRIDSLFDVHSRIEIYTPAAQRVHGYYVTPFLLGDRLVGRVDLQRDRSAQTLRAHRVSWETGEEHT